MINRQIAFNLAVTGLLAQGEKALNEDACVYLAPNGNRCAVGMLIDPERYYPEIEGGSVLSRHFKLSPMLLDEVGRIEADTDLDFLSDLQCDLHDHCGPISVDTLPRDLFIARAENLAAKYGLTMPQIEGE